MVKKILHVSLVTKMLKIRHLHILLPKVSASRRDFDKTKCMSFLTKEEKCLENYNEIWENVNNSIKKEFNNELVYNKKYLKTEIKSYEQKINTKKGCQCICISETLIDSVYRKDTYYYPQVFLEKYKNFVKI